MASGAQVIVFRAKLQKLLIATLLLAGLVFLMLQSQTKASDNTLTIGSKNCTEQHILAEILAQLVETHTDLKVKRLFNLEGTSICFNALKSRTIDVYFEYTGTALLDILKEPLKQGPLYPYLKEVFAKQNLSYLDPLSFSNQYVLIARADSSLHNISDIPPHVRIAIDPELAARKDLKLLQQAYMINQQPKLMDQVLLYFSLQNNAIDVMSGFSTDGRLKSSEFRALIDDRKALPNYVAAPLVRKEVLEQHPQLISVFVRLKDQIEDSEISDLNYQVETLGYNVPSVVRKFLKDAIVSL
ncbi:MAG: glycine betaine ABC transporter substrate-binding protein [Simkaniaceae bacterium]|nr:glycine betaine ABC transporter substrate-binding protein [Candidatus Sacchlamyda saccharinae]